jgi:hypothetical protein
MKWQTVGLIKNNQFITQLMGTKSAQSYTPSFDFGISHLNYFIYEKLSFSMPFSNDLLTEFANDPTRFMVVNVLG